MQNTSLRTYFNSILHIWRETKEFVQIVNSINKLPVLGTSKYGSFNLFIEPKFYTGSKDLIYNFL